MKLKKKSGLMGAVIALSAASLVSVGFASWVISQGDTKTVDGTIFVDTAETKTHTITVSPTSGAQINYTRPQSPEATTYSWLSEDTSNYESLAATFSVSVANVLDTTVADATAKFEATLEAGVVSGENFTPNAKTSGSETGYYSAYAQHLVDQLPTPVISNESLSGGTWSATVTVTFKWGSYFSNGIENVNPYYFYNAHAWDDEITEGVTYAADAQAKLTALNTALSGVSYRLTLNFSD